MALPLALLWGVGTTLLACLHQPLLWPLAALVVVSVLLMMVLNNANALIRVYSRMVSCAYMFMLGACPFLLAEAGAFRGMVFTCAFVLFCILLFRVYQMPQASGSIYYAFLMLGICVLLFPQMLFFLPLFLVLLFTCVMSGCLQTVVAALLGVLTPLWCVAAWLLFCGEVELLLSLPVLLIDFGPLCDFSGLDLRQWVSLAFVCLLSLVGTVHFQRQGYQDKIRTRLLYRFFIFTQATAVTFFVLQPQHAAFLLRIMLVCTAPLIAHFIALTRTRATNIAFCVMVSVAVLLTLFNILFPPAVWIS